MFETNVGGRDRQLRLGVGTLLAVGGVALLARSAVTAGLGALAGSLALLASAVARRCTVNKLLGIDTSG
jgi:hypothetical protein